MQKLLSIALLSLIACIRAQQCGSVRSESGGKSFDCSAGCAECTSETSCSECLPGYGDNSLGGCEKCSFFVDNCRFCSEDPGRRRELVRNGGFEEDVLDRFSYNIEPSGWHGTVGIAVGYTDFGRNNIFMTNGQFISQTVSGFITGHNYKLTFYCYVNTKDIVVHVGSLVYYPNCGKTYYDWDFQEFTFTAPSASIILSIKNNAYYNEAFDEISILAPTEPVCSKCNQSFLVNPDTGQCEPCADPNCLDCSTSPCNQCAPGFQVNSESQLCEECPAGTFPDSYGVCTDCYDSACASCTKTSCLECAPGFIKSPYGVCECQKGFFLSEGGECKKCADPNCFDCSSTECLWCSCGFILKDGVCLEGRETIDSVCSSYYSRLLQVLERKDLGRLEVSEESSLVRKLSQAQKELKLQAQPTGERAVQVSSDN